MVTQMKKKRGKAKVAATAVRAYKPNLEKSPVTTGLVFSAIPSEIFLNQQVFIDVSRKGIPGSWVKKVIEETGLRDVFLDILNVSSGNLSRIYHKKALQKEASEEVLDAVRVLRQSQLVWESNDLAMQWLNSPVASLGGERPIRLFDTFEGRRWMSQVLNKIEHGEFS